MRISQKTMKKKVAKSITNVDVTNVVTLSLYHPMQSLTVVLPVDLPLTVSQRGT